MPTLTELRRWMAGEDVAGLPARSLAWDRGHARKEEPNKVSPKTPFWHLPGVDVVTGVDVDVAELAYDEATPEELLLKEAGEDELPPARPSKGKRVRPPGSSDFKLTSDGKDAVLLFGRHTGRALSEIARTSPEYLGYLITADEKEPKHPDLMALVRRWFGWSGKTPKELLRDGVLTKRFDERLEVARLDDFEDVVRGMAEKTDEMIMKRKP